VGPCPHILRARTAIGCSYVNVVVLLSVLCRDSMQVKSDAVVLYVIQPGQFLDSTEYQSTPQLDNIFKVCCRIITGHARLYGPSLRPFVSRMS